jgi:hypothetical protein
MNPVTASATFHVGQFLEDIVGVATTRGDMSATFPTKPMKVQGSASDFKERARESLRIHTKVP